MFIFNTKRRLSDSGLFHDFSDAHCHLLPGVDDGVETLDESLAILSRYEQLGIRQVWLTPHVMEDVPNATASLRERFASLTAAYRGPVVLHLAAEYMLDSLFHERLLSGDLLPWGPSGNRLLVETSFVHAPVNVHDLLRGVQSRGYFPLLAHPERYLYMNPLEFRALKQQGVEFQLNIFSLFGFYGYRVRENARFLLEEGLYSCAGTDLHALSHLEPALQQKLRRKTIEAIRGLGRK